MCKGGETTGQDGNDGKGNGEVGEPAHAAEQFLGISEAAQIGAILQVDARHAAALALLAHRSPTPYGAFDIPISKARARERIARF